MSDQPKPLMHKVTIYSDGGCYPNPGTGGFGAILIYGALEKEISGGAAQTTNNRMELTAACAALEALKSPCEVEFYTDSKYVQQGITQWLPRWIKNGWRTASKKPVENKDLWLRLYMEAKRHTIQWKWVKGHAGNEYNERCDQLATAARLNAAITNS